MALGDFRVASVVSSFSSFGKASLGGLAGAGIALSTGDSVVAELESGAFSGLLGLSSGLVAGGEHGLTSLALSIGDEVLAEPFASVAFSLVAVGDGWSFGGLDGCLGASLCTSRLSCNIS